MSLKKKFIGAGMVAVMSVSFATGAFADTGDVTKSNNVDLTIKSSEIGNGGLDLETSTIQSFGEIDLKADPETYNTSFNENFTVKDLRGTQEGWALDVSASQFDNGDHQLPEGSLTLDGVDTIDRVGSGLGELPQQDLNSTSIIDDGAVAVASAEAGKGMGVFDLDFDENALGLTVDATTAKVGTYETTLTWTLHSTPVAE